MPGSHPVLGLLAVAVCISFAEGAAFPFILKDESSANKLQEPNSDRLLIAGKHKIAQERSLKKNSNHASMNEDEGQQNTNIIAGRNAAYNHRDSGFGEVRNLTTSGGNALRREAAAADGSGDIGDKSASDGGLVANGESLQSQETYSSSSEESKESTEEPSDTSGLGSAVSASEENCEDDKETGRSTSSTSATTTSSTTSQPTEQSSDSYTEDHTSPSPPEQTTEEECEDTEPTQPTQPTSEGSESSGSSSQSQETEVPDSQECEETEEPTRAVQSTKPTRTTTSTTSKKTRIPDDDRSSRNFEDSDSSGVEFSDSKSDVSEGDSTNLSAWDRR